MLGKVMDISYTKPAHLEIVNTLLTRVYMGSYILWLFVKKQLLWRGASVYDAFENATSVSVTAHDRARTNCPYRLHQCYL